MNSVADGSSLKGWEIMKKKFLKKLISTLLSTVLVACLVTPVSAETAATRIEDEDLLINQEVAENIAELFVDDMVNSGQTKWNSDTEVTHTEILYDEQGENITAYSVELTTGYVVVSAYVDVPSVIFEWADETEPVYEGSLSAETKVIYTGPMGYLLDNGALTLQNLEGKEVFRSQVPNQIETLRDMQNVQPSVLQEIVTAKKAALIANGQEATTQAAADNHSGGYITDAGVYARNVYGGTWTCTDWYNQWEDYANFATTSNFSGYSNHCGPTAITNAIKMYGNRYNNYTIKNSSNVAVFNKVIEANWDSGNYYYNGGDGTFDDSADAFIRDSFAKFGVNVSTYGRYYCTVDNIKNATTSDRLMYIMLHSYGEPYGNHAVIGYAWSRMTRSSDLGDKHFVKVCDGHKSSGRYLEVSLFIDDQYWEIHF